MDSAPLLLLLVMLWGARLPAAVVWAGQGWSWGPGRRSCMADT